MLIRVSNTFLCIDGSANTSLQGLVDLDAEIAKSEKKLQLAKLNLSKLKTAEAVPGYEENVPIDAQIMNEERVSQPIITFYPF